MGSGDKGRGSAAVCVRVGAVHTWGVSDAATPPLGVACETTCPTRGSFVSPFAPSFTISFVWLAACSVGEGSVCEQVKGGGGPRLSGTKSRPHHHSCQTTFKTANDFRVYVVVFATMYFTTHDQPVTRNGGVDQSRACIAIHDAKGTRIITLGSIQLFHQHNSWLWSFAPQMCVDALCGVANAIPMPTPHPKQDRQPHSSMPAPRNSLGCVTSCSHQPARHRLHSQGSWGMGKGCRTVGVW